MFTKTNPTLYSLLLLGILLLPVSASAEPQAGIVIIAAGDVYATKEGQSPRALTRRSKFFTGETIIVGENGKAQVRFQDGTILSLTKGTELRIEAFSYNDEDGNEDANIVTLLKGGFRTITGAVAKKNPANHKVNTPVATIGVRGTNYSVAIDDSVYVGVWGGVVFVENDGGSIELGDSEAFSYAQVSDSNIAPEGIVEPPQVLVETVAVNSEAPAGDTAGETSTALAGIAEPATADTDTATLAVVTGADASTASDNVFEQITEEPVVTTATSTSPSDSRLSVTEKTSLDRIGIATRLASNTIYIGDGSDGTAGAPIVRNGAIDSTTGFSDAILRKGNAVDAGSVSSFTIGSKQVHWGTWDATIAGQEAVVQTDAADATAETLIQDTVMWMTVEPTDAALLSALTSTGTWSGTIVAGQYDGITDNSQALSNMSFDSAVDFATGAVTNTALQATTATDVWNVQFQDGVLSGASINLTADSATSSMTRTPMPTESVSGSLNGALTGDNAEGIAAQFSLESSGGATLDGRFLSNCATCP
jgi:hypothetical protein